MTYNFKDNTSDASLEDKIAIIKHNQEEYRSLLNRLQELKRSSTKQQPTITKTTPPKPISPRLIIPKVDEPDFIKALN